MSKKTQRFDEEAALEEYRELLKDYEQPSDNELVLKMQSLLPTEKAILCLYIACDCKINYLARLLHTSNAYGKKLITEIQNKIKSNDVLH